MLGAMPGDDALSEHAAYLSDTHLLALLEMGLEATIRDIKDDTKRSPSGEDPLNFLATWLMRHNPKHSAEGKALLDQFAHDLGERKPLADTGDLEQRQEMEAAMRVQAAARGHSARLLAGEQKKDKKEMAAATRMQAASRGKVARQERAEQNVAAEKLQAQYRGHVDREMVNKQRQQEAMVQQAAATAMQSAMRGRMIRSAGPSSDDEYVYITM